MTHVTKVNLRPITDVLVVLVWERLVIEKFHSISVMKVNDKDIDHCDLLLVNDRQLH